LYHHEKNLVLHIKSKIVPTIVCFEIGFFLVTIFFNFYFCWKNCEIFGNFLLKGRIVIFSFFSKKCAGFFFEIIEKILFFFYQL